MLLKLIIIAAFAACCSGQSNKLPDELQICHRKDASVNSCLIKAIQSALVFFKNGNQLFKIPSLDPYHVDQMAAEHTGGSSNFNLKSTVTKGDLVGLHNVAIKKLVTKFDKKFGLKAEVFNKKLELVGDYTMNGQIVVLPIKGVGKANMSLSDITTLVDMRGEYFNKNGDQFINITRLSLKMTPKRASYYFENIFNGDPVLSETILNFMNENSELVSKTLLPGYADKLSEKFKDIANSIFHNFPMKMIFPE